MSESKVICVSGGCDPIHGGIIDMLKAAAEYGNVVFILNSDVWLARKKGYCMMPWEERAKILKSIKYVYDVVPVDDINGGTVCDALRSIKPDFFGNGGDRNEYNTPEKSLCDSLGIELVWGLGGEKSQSSSQLVDAVVGCIMGKLKT